MTGRWFVVGRVTVGRQTTMTNRGQRPVGDAHAVPAGGGSVAVCGTRVDQVESDRPFPPTRGPGSPDPCPLCVEGIKPSAPGQHRAPPSWTVPTHWSQATEGGGAAFDAADLPVPPEVIHALAEVVLHQPGSKVGGPFDPNTVEVRWRTA